MPTPNESYQYDSLYRLQQVDDATGAPWQSYSYDKTGDRLSKTTALQANGWMYGLGYDNTNRLTLVQQNGTRPTYCWCCEERSQASKCRIELLLNNTEQKAAILASAVSG